MQDKKVGFEALAALISYSSIVPAIALIVWAEFVYLRKSYGEKIPAVSEFSKAVYLRLFIFVLGIEYFGEYENVLRFASIFPWTYWPVFVLILIIPIFWFRRQQVRDTKMPGQIFTTKYQVLTSVLFTAYVVAFDIFLTKFVR